MKSVGEAMAIGRLLRGIVRKPWRSLETGMPAGAGSHRPNETPGTNSGHLSERDAALTPAPDRIFFACAAEEWLAGAATPSQEYIHRAGALFIMITTVFLRREAQEAERLLHGTDRWS